MLHARNMQYLIAVFVAVVGGVLALGASRLPVEKGYSILGPQIFPYAISALMLVLSISMVVQTLRSNTNKGHSIHAESSSGPGRAGAAWVTVGLVVVAVLINVIGFVLASALLFALAARGFGSKSPVRDLIVGISLVLPVYWLFTTGLGVSLPPLVNAWI